MAEQEIARLVIRLRAETAELNKNLQGAKDQLNSFFSSIKAIGAGIGLTWGIAELVREMKSLVSAGIQYNSTVEQQILGIGSLIAATGDVLDAEGRRLAGMEKINAAMEISRGLYEQLRLAAIKTTGTTQELIDVFQSMLAPGREAGLALEQMVKLSTMVVQAMKAMQLPLIQARVELRGLLTGEENVRMDIMKRLGIEGEVVKKMIEEGKLYDYLEEKLKIFDIAGEKQVKTWEGMKSTLRDIMDQIKGRIALPLFDDLKRAMEYVIERIGLTRDGTGKLSADFESFIAKVQAAYTVLSKAFEAFLPLIDTAGSAASAMIKAIAGGLLSVVTGLTTIWYMAVKISEGIAALFSAAFGNIIPFFKNWQKEAKAISDRVEAALIQQAESLRVVLGLQEKITKEQDKQIKKPTAPPQKPGPSPEELKKEEKAYDDLTKKTKEYEVKLLELEDPIQADRLALENFIAEKTKDVIKTARLIEATVDLRMALEKYQQQLEKKKAEESYKKALDNITGKFDELNLEMLQLIDPLAAEQWEFELLVKRLTAGGKEAGNLSAAIEDLRKAFFDLKNEQRRQAEEQANIEANLRVTLANIENSITRLNLSYRKGEIGLESYFSNLIGYTQESAEAEIYALKKRLEAAKTEEERIKLRAEISQRIIELERKLLEIGRDRAEEEKKRAQQAVSLRELEINQKLVEIEDRRKRAIGSNADLIIEEIELQKQRLKLYQDLLSYIDRLSDPQGYISVQSSIAEINRRIMELNYNLGELTGPVLEGLEQGWKEYFFELRSQFQGSKEAMKAILGEMRNTFKSIFIDAVKGDLKNWQDYFRKIGDAILDAMGNLVADMVMTWLKGMMQMKSGSNFLLDLFKQVGSWIGGIFGTGAGAGAAAPAGGQQGGLITAGSGLRDDVPILAMKGEYVQPREAVRYYGAGVMEALRQKLIPKEFFNWPRTLMAYQTFQAGGPIGGGQSIAVNVPVNVRDPRFASRMRESIEETVVRVLKEFSR